MQTEAIPDSQDKTPVAQMHFASEFLLSRDSCSINGKNIAVPANSG
jgi:hypothetical protein